MTTEIAAPSLHAVLRDALLDSRQRWRDLVAMVSDLAWETDIEGRLIFVAPEDALGWTANALIGRPADSLLAAPDGGIPLFSPFRPDRPRRGVRAWLKRGDGSLACLSCAAVPLFDASGQIIGSRGVCRDVTEEETRNAALAGALRREALMDAIMQESRTEVLAQGMLAGAVRALGPAMGAGGAAVLRRHEGAMASLVMVGDGLPGLVSSVTALEGRIQRGSVAVLGPEARPLIVAEARQPGGGGGLLALWRMPDGRAWDEEEQDLVRTAADFIGMILAHEAMQSEMFRQARTDPLTGLLNRRAFMEEIDRRIERLGRQRQPAALLFIDLDNFKPVNDRLGHEAGDAALRAAAQMLRAAVRPADLVARLGGDEFALWLDGADERIAAMRATRLVADAPLSLAHHAVEPGLPLTFSVGIAVRDPGSQEDTSHLIVRADTAMYEAKRRGKAGWSVATATSPARPA